MSKLKDRSVLLEKLGQVFSGGIVDLPSLLTRDGARISSQFMKL
jgi:hypothetical protein